MKRNKIIIIFLVISFVFFVATEILYNVSYPLNYKEYITKYSKEYDIDPYLLMAIINAESSFVKDAQSQKGAIGLMQLTEPTAVWIATSMGNENFTINDLYNPETNIKMGTWYLDNLKKEFHSTVLVLAAYNAGRGTVGSWLSNSEISEDGKTLHYIPYLETKTYIRKVLAGERIYALLYRTNDY